ncbi:MAG: tryptophan synthase subunit alpha [Candidatus Caldarchaeum sp.]
MEIEELFEKCRNTSGEGVHMAHVYYGDPCEDFSQKLIQTLAENGADMIEFGIPFSDPIADGETFQAACERALKAGITPRRCIEGIRKLRNTGIIAPIVVTTYFNIPCVMGFDKFLTRVREAGAQAVLIPDLPFEEAQPFIERTTAHKLHLILQAAPTTSKKRLEKIIKHASGFLYVIGLEGVTGSMPTDQPTTLELVKTIKMTDDVPLMVGFGISRKEQAEVIVSAGADGVAVGSAYARIYSQNLNNPYDKLPEVAKLASEIKLGCINGYRARKHIKLTT